MNGLGGELNRVGLIWMHAQVAIVVFSLLPAPASTANWTGARSCDTTGSQHALGLVGHGVGQVDGRSAPLTWINAVCFASNGDLYFGQAMWAQTNWPDQTHESEIRYGTHDGHQVGQVVRAPRPCIICSHLALWAAVQSHACFAATFSHHGHAPQAALDRSLVSSTTRGCRKLGRDSGRLVQLSISGRGVRRSPLPMDRSGVL